jgi:hypothetical protein
MYSASASVRFLGQSLSRLRTALRAPVPENQPRRQAVLETQDIWTRALVADLTLLPQGLRPRSLDPYLSQVPRQPETRRHLLDTVEREIAVSCYMAEPSDATAHLLGRVPAGIPIDQIARIFGSLPHDVKRPVVAYQFADDQTAGLTGESTAVSEADDPALDLVGYRMAEAWVLQLALQPSSPYSCISMPGRTGSGKRAILLRFLPRLASSSSCFYVDLEGLSARERLQDIREKVEGTDYATVFLDGLMDLTMGELHQMRQLFSYLINSKKLRVVLVGSGSESVTRQGFIIHEISNRLVRQGLSLFLPMRDKPLNLIQRREALTAHYPWDDFDKTRFAIFAAPYLPPYLPAMEAVACLLDGDSPPGTLESGLRVFAEAFSDADWLDGVLEACNVRVVSAYEKDLDSNTRNIHRHREAFLVSLRT